MRALRTDLATRARYSQAGGIHRLVPTAVGRPATPDDLAQVLEWARERGLAITPRGAGTAMDGSSIGDGLVLDLTALATPLEVDAEARRARVGAGARLRDLQAAAASAGLRYGPEPSSARWATVGGMLGTNAAGARTYRLGPVADWVEDVSLLTADGSMRLSRTSDGDPSHPVVRRMRATVLPLAERHAATIRARRPATRKDTAGYRLVPWLDSGRLIDLVVGSEGTLSIVTEATLRLEPIPAASGTLRVVLETRAAIPAAVEALVPADPSAIELLDASFLKLVAAHGVREASWEGAGAVLLVELEGDSPGAVRDRIAEATRALSPVAREVTAARDADEAAALWSLRHEASPILAAISDGRRSLQVVEDGCVPLAALPAYLDTIAAACRDAAMDVVMFGHAGDGHVHVNLLPDLDRPDWLEAVRGVFTRVSQAVIALGGTPAGEHGAGRLRAPLLEGLLGPDALAVMRAIKAAFDPEGRMNPGVILDAAPDPLTRLKVGADRTMIPSEVEAELEAIEQERRWDAERWR